MGTTFTEESAEKVASNYRVNLVKTKEASFQDLVDKYKNTLDEDRDPSLYKLLQDINFFDCIIAEKLLSNTDVNHLFRKIDSALEINSLCKNLPLMKHILAHQLLDQSTFSTFSQTLKSFKLFNAQQMTSMFDLIEWHATHRYADSAWSEKDSDELDFDFLQTVKSAKQQFNALNVKKLRSR